MQESNKIIVNKCHYLVNGYRKYFNETGLDQSKIFTGKTTGVLLQKIGEAMLNPNQPVLLQEGSRSIADQCLHLLNKLDLKFFEVSKQNTTLVYKPFVEVDLEEAVEFFIKNKLEEI